MGAARVVDEELIRRVVGLQQAAAVILDVPRLVGVNGATMKAGAGAAADGVEVIRLGWSFLLPRPAEGGRGLRDAGVRAMRGGETALHGRDDLRVPGGERQAI